MSLAIPKRSLPFVPRSSTSSGCASSSAAIRSPVTGLERAVGEHERRQRLLPARERRDVPFQRRPVREAVPPGEVAPGVADGHPVHRGDPVRPAFVVLDVVVERLLDLHAGRAPASSGSRARARARAARSPAAPAGRRAARGRSDLPHAQRATSSLACFRSCSTFMRISSREARVRGRARKKIGSMQRYLPSRWAQPCPRTGCALTRSRRIA